MQELWDGFIDFTEKLVVPDWSALVALIPLGIAALVGLFLVWNLARAFRAPPRRVGVRRLTPVAPAGIHMPGPSFAPILAALGTTLLFFGIIAGGLALWAGIIALLVTLLYWGREAVRDYDHIPDVAADGGSIPVLPPVSHPGPPAGVHMPGPSFRPILGAIGSTVLLFGFVVGGPLLIAGAIVLAITLLGWLFDAGREFRATQAADITGHIDNGPAPRWPKATFVAVLAIVVVAGVLASGFLPIGRGEAGASAPPGGSAPPPASQPPGGSGQPSAPPADADVVLTAQGVQWLETSLSAPADTPFTLALDNRDAGVPHDVRISDQAGAVVFHSDVITGPAVQVFEVPALAPGAYPYVCTIHPNMTGTLTAG
jgi:hypothetical protein